MTYCLRWIYLIDFLAILLAIIKNIYDSFDMVLFLQVSMGPWHNSYWLYGYFCLAYFAVVMVCIFCAKNLNVVVVTTIVVVLIIVMFVTNVFKAVMWGV